MKRPDEVVAGPGRRHGRVRPGLWVILLWSVLALLAPAAPGAAPGKPFWRPELAPVGPMVMLISLDEQRLYVYRNGVAIGESRISSGRRGYETPTGVYTILQKEREHYSNLYDNAPMPYMQRLTWDGLALHAGVLPGHPASHGCIRLPEAFAEQLFLASARGTVVVVTDQRVAPPQINHPAAVAPLDLGDQPGPAMADGDGAAWPADDGGPVSVVMSTHDRTLFVLQSGRRIARTPVDVPDGFRVGGMVLYVRRASAGVVAEQDGGLWSAYRILGEGAAPAPRELATRLKVPDAFGARLRERIAPGTTVLVTDLPAQGGQPVPYGTLLEAQERVPPG